MKLTLIIESLGSGGAERQIVMLAIGLANRGFEVELVIYFPDLFYKYLLDNTQVKFVLLRANTRLQRFYAICQHLKYAEPDLVIAFLESTSSYVELASIPKKKWKLIVSERSAYKKFPKGMQKIRKFMHLISDAVTTNSHTNRLMLEIVVPRLKNKIFTIYNAVDLNKFEPLDQDFSIKKSNKFNIIVAARVDSQKNLLQTILAVDDVVNRHNNKHIILNWYGRYSDNMSYYNQAYCLIDKLKLGKNFKINAPVQDIRTLYHMADVVMLPSLYEGIPNAVCEAMACGKPVLLSNVCDAGNFVFDNYNGFVFDPHNFLNISSAIVNILHKSSEELYQMGKNSRKIAEKLFMLELFIDRYENLIYSLMNGDLTALKNLNASAPRSATKYIEKLRS